MQLHLEKGAAKVPPQHVNKVCLLRVQTKDPFWSIVCLKLDKKQKPKQ